jgi:hypothetical protein
LENSDEQNLEIRWFYNRAFLRKESLEEDILLHQQMKSWVSKSLFVIWSTCVVVKKKVQCVGSVIETS